MNGLTRTIAVVAFLLTCASIVAAQTSVSIGIQIGAPPPPRVVYVAQRPAPDPAYVWVDGYWYPVNHRYVWHDGYWTRPPYPGARWVPARHDGRMFFEGYWVGSGGKLKHDHRWDGNHERDYHPGNGRGRGRGKGH